MRPRRPRWKNPEYAVWCGMIHRCTYWNDPSFPDYGGRGIRVCDRWMGVGRGHGFDNFYQDMGPRPPGKHPSGHPTYTIDRIDNDGHYEPGNCRWATAKEQIANRGRRSASAVANEVCDQCYRRYQTGADLLCDECRHTAFVWRTRLTPPDCPIHGWSMRYADGAEPHWRCEFWVGWVRCGETAPIGVAAVSA